MHAWILAFHLIAVVCWFAALFYLPRLFVYHAMIEDDIGIERFKVMERKLYRGIATPSMIATIVLGGWLVLMAPDYFLNQAWFQVKLAPVVCMVGYHHICLAHMKKLANGTSDKSPTYFRIFNEIPVLFLVGIIILVIVKPF